MLAVVMATVVALAVAPPPTPPTPQPPPAAEGGAERVLAELLPAVPVAPGVTHRELRTTAVAGEVMGDVAEADLANPGVRIDLLTPGAVAARAPLAEMADRGGAVAAINGDFFDIGRTSAPVGPAVAGGRPLKAAVPHHRRIGPAVPGAEVDHVLAVDRAGVGRLDRLRLVASARTGAGTLPLVALNQYAVPAGGIGIFTPDWGDADRAVTLCGSGGRSDSHSASHRGGRSAAERNAPCAADQAEVLVHDGVVAPAGPPGAGRIAPGDLVLTGREQGAAALRALASGERVHVEYALAAASGNEPYFAVGGSPIVVGGAPAAGLDDRERAPRSAAGVGPDGRRMWLLTVDGRQPDSVGATLRELAALLREMGVHDAVNLDGGGSSTLVLRLPGAAGVTIVNDPSDASPRLVPNGIGVHVDERASPG